MDKTKQLVTKINDNTISCSNTLHKSRNRLWTGRKKDSESKSKGKQYCIYYNRFDTWLSVVVFLGCVWWSSFVLCWQGAVVVGQSAHTCMILARVVICSEYVQSVVNVLSPSLTYCCWQVSARSCDKTDGSCPFSHDVSKEKVSLYFGGGTHRLPLPFLYLDAGVFLFHSWIMH